MTLMYRYEHLLHFRHITNVEIFHFRRIFDAKLNVHVLSTHRINYKRRLTSLFFYNTKKRASLSILFMKYTKYST